MATLTHPDMRSGAPVNISRVPVEQPLQWLQRGWEDLRHNPGPSLAYGLLVSLFGALVLTFWSHPFLIAGSISGFLLVGPLLTTGLVELSRRRERGEPLSFDASLSALGRHREALVRFSVGLLVIAAVWFAVSTVLLATVLGSAAPSLGATVWGSLLDQVSRGQLLSYFAVGGILAAIVFARSVVAVPMIVDRDTSAAQAVRTSHRVTLKDLPAMLIWASFIVLLTVLGFASFLVGMVVVFPLLGHATWHAYRDLVQ
ncbi:hypothetical protein CKO31_10950 [Thiohalocapsa halophila]|uniref:DUF2189 domain-containing protein n=1 Tax=Thiohalocapsa halophila TaxID=69359 RepID=A0ABS1CH52_9GAMM|nr:DUF2189 domain-containing protein [Thiohalocapsa halophila]MBK1631247.1 hypothetical protein [Thiohalocapsa halophila]